jgi:DNA-binding IclR family transcriptional regulator
MRENGFAKSYEEVNVGVWGMAIPVVSPVDVVCAVGVAGPSPRLRKDLVRRAVRLAHQAAEDLARALGYSVPQLSVGAATLGPPTGTDGWRKAPA